MLKSKTNLLTIFCVYCKVSFANITTRSFMLHMKAYHSELKENIICGICRSSSLSMAALQRHLRLHSNGLINEKSPPENLRNAASPAIASSENCDHEESSLLDVTPKNAGDCEHSEDTDQGNEVQQAVDPQNDKECPLLDAGSLNDVAARKFLLSLYGKGNTTRKQIQDMVECTSSLMETSCALLSTALTCFIQALPDEALQQPQCLQHFSKLKESLAVFANPFHRMATENQRIEMFKRQNLVMPRSYHLGFRTEKQNDGLVKLVPSTAQYVSVVETLSHHITSARLNISQPSVGMLTSYEDGQAYKASPYFKQYPEAMRLQLYHDDIEVANPLGSKAGVHKLTMFYYAIEGQRTSSLKSIHLAIVAYATDIKQHGYSKVLKPLVDDLKALDQGIYIKAVDGDRVVLRARLVQLLGDNLAANQILGLAQSFNADHFCRFCMMKSIDTRSAVELGDVNLRQRTMHANHLAQLLDNPSSTKSHGVKAPCALDCLDYFHGIESSVPDCMHDVLEGVGKREVKLLLNSLIAKRVITLEEFNKRLVNITYWRHEYSDKPSVQTNLESIKQTASQTWCLLRYLPFIIGDLVAVENEQWQVYLSLRGLMDMIFSPTITLEATYAYESAVSEHHFLYLAAYPGENLTPKHHFMLHYGQFMRVHGPLCSYWCMRFEAKHRLAKVVATVSCNFRNIPLTVAERYQLQCFAKEQLESNQTEEGPDIRIGDAYHIQEQSDTADEPLFGEVLNIDPTFNTVTVTPLHTRFDVHMHAYRVLGDLNNIRICKMSRQQKLSIVRTNEGNKYICLRHIIC